MERHSYCGKEGREASQFCLEKEVRGIAHQIQEEFNLMKENLHFRLGFEPQQYMPKDIFCSMFVLYLEIIKQAFPWLLTTVI